MIPYVYYPPIDLDFNELEQIVFNVNGIFVSDLQELRWLVYTPLKSSELLAYQREVDRYPYLTEVRKKIPILGPIFNIYILKPEEIIKTHVDSNRLSALNIPIKNTTGASTFFYKEIPNKKYHVKRTTFDLVDTGDELFRFNMDRTVLFNTTIPHKVINHQPNYRIMISWGFTCSFEEAVQFFESMSVL
jgi:hypothetical protein